MIPLNIIIFFSVASSIILFSGIGSDRLFLDSHSTRIDWKYYLVLIPFTLIISIILWAMNKYVIIPLRISFLTPVLFILVLVGIDELLSSITNIRYNTPAEKNFSYGIVFFAIYESASLFTIITIVLTGFLSLFILSCLVSHIKSRVDMGNADISWRIAPLTLISIGFIILATYATEISWLNHIFW